MSQQKHPRRFIVIPKVDTLLAGRSAPRATLGESISGHRASAKKAAATAGPRRVLPPQVRIIDTSPPDGAMLLAAPGATLTQLRARAGNAQVVEEHWYSLQRISLRPEGFRRAAFHAGTATQHWTIRVRLHDDSDTPLKDALVIAIPVAGRDSGDYTTTDGSPQLCRAGVIASRARYGCQSGHVSQAERRSAWQPEPR